MSRGTLIVGASQAGLQLALSLRKLGDLAPITLVGEEDRPPYQRPPLSKEFLAGQVVEEALDFRTPGFYTENGIELVSGERVTEVALSSEGLVTPRAASGSAAGGVATTATGRRLHFDRLALTVGAAPRRLDLPGAGLEGICHLRDRDDARELRTRLACPSRVIVIGGGFIGLEVASVARTMGREVTVVEAADRLMARAVSPFVSEFYREAHERRGTSVLLSTAVSGFDGADGRVSAVLLGDGTRLPADLVLVGVGAVPRTELARQLGLECDGGIVVDAQARTSRPDVVAAGDCTVQPHPLTGKGRVRLESVQNAVAQAQTAAATQLGIAREGKPAVPWFWSFQGDLKLQAAGLSAGYDEYVVRGEVGGERFSVLYYCRGRLQAVDAVNTPADYMTVRRALAQGGTIPSARAGDASVPLKHLVVTPERDMGAHPSPAAVDARQPWPGGRAGRGRS